MFPEISDYLKSSLGSNVSNLVQPDKITAATLFLLLNFIDIILNASSLSAPGNPLHLLYNTFLNMDPILQGGAVFALIIMLAYLLLSFNTAITKLFTGESWSETWPGRWLKNRQTRKRKYLIAKSRGGDVDNYRANLELITSFAQEEAYTYPTALGNVQSATASYIWHHYGMDLAALLTHMESVIDACDHTLSTNIDNEKAALDFLVNMTFLFMIFVVELIVQSFILLAGWAVIWALIPVALAAITYQGAVIKARTWGDAVQVAFDTHRDDLRQKLDVRAFTSEEDERAVWRKVSYLLLWGLSADDVFDLTASAAASSASPASATANSGAGSDSSSSAANKTSSAPALTNAAIVKTTANVQVDIESTVVTLLDLPGAAQPSNILQVAHQYVDYSLFISNSAKDDIKDVFLYVTDPRLPAIYEEPQHVEKTGSGVLHNPNGFSTLQQVLWWLSDIPGNSSLRIRYRLPSTTFAAATHDKNLHIVSGKVVGGKAVSTETLCQETGAIDYTFVVKNAGSGPVKDGTLEVFESRKPLPDTPKYGCLCDSRSNVLRIIQAKKLTAPDRYRWEFGDIDEGITLTYTL